MDLSSRTNVLAFSCRPRPQRRSCFVMARCAAEHTETVSPLVEDTISRRGAALTSISALLIMQIGDAGARGLEAIPPAERSQESYTGVQRQNQQFLDKNSETFENSELLRTLRERTNANQEKNRRALQDRYCYRQAELGVGDCAGLRLIPGATKSGKQKPPEWLKGILQKLGQYQEETQVKASPEAAVE